jgi:hypothetical protein
MAAGNESGQIPTASVIPCSYKRLLSVPVCLCLSSQNLMWGATLRNGNKIKTSCKVQAIMTMERNDQQESPGVRCKADVNGVPELPAESDRPNRKVIGPKLRGNAASNAQ